ncbi:MAG: hypothetical protein M1457_10265 [bacterium]|nr:hypothetical protein [bacterium]
MRSAIVLFSVVLVGITSACCSICGREEHSKSAADSSVVWMCHADAAALAAPGAQWEHVKANLPVLEMFIDRVGSRYSDGELRAIADMCRRNRIRIAIECGGPLGVTAPDATEGETSARIELKKIARLARAGATPDYLNLDHPIRRINEAAERNGTAFSLDQAVAELVDYMKAVRAVYPQIQFYLLSNFPNWGWKGERSYTGQTGKPMGWGDYYPVVTKAIDAANAAGIPLAGVTVDFPYDYATGLVRHPGFANDPQRTDWIARIRELENLVHGRGLKFTLIVNSQRGGARDPKLYSEDTLAYIDLYRAAGGKPDVWLVESWYRYPRRVVPETEPYTMTNLVWEVMKKVEK